MNLILKHRRFLSVAQCSFSRTTRIPNTNDVVKKINLMCANGQFNEAIEYVERFCDRGLPVQKDHIQCLLNYCIRKEDVEAVKRVHSLIIRARLESVLMLTDQLIRVFALCGSLLDANYVFGQIKTPTLYSWHAIISAHVVLEKNHVALELFCYMQSEGCFPNVYIFSCILNVCCKIGDLECGRLSHHAILCIQLESNVTIATALTNMYMKCVNIQDANKVFAMQINKNVISWGAMIARCTEHGLGSRALQLFRNMQVEGMEPDRAIFLGAIKACRLLEQIPEGNIVHSMIIEDGLDFENSIQNSLLDMYSKCGSFDDAVYVFNKQKNKDIVSWGALISGSVHHGSADIAFQLLEKMELEGLRPNRYLIVSAIKACNIKVDLHQVYCIHDMVVRDALETDQIVGNSLIDMYTKCGRLSTACRIFDSMKKKDVVTWGAMMTGYVQNGLCLDALDLFVRMSKAGVQPDCCVFSCVLNACAAISDVKGGNMIHEQVLKHNFDMDIIVSNAILNMYIKCQSLEDAHRVFDKMNNCDHISWATMIGGYADNGRGLEALQMFTKMELQGVSPNRVSFLYTLKACCCFDSSREGKVIHDRIVMHGLDCDVIIQNTLIDMYCKYGELKEARNIFDQLPCHSIVSWGAMISGYVQHGYGFDALQVFADMHKKGVKPNQNVINSSLKACGSIGAVCQGKLIHGLIIESGLELDTETGDAVLDMYAKCGSLDEAQNVFRQLHVHSEVTWTSLIVAYASNGHSRLVMPLLKEMNRQGSKPNAKIFMGILIACSHAGRVEEACTFLKSMVEDYYIKPTIEHYTCMIDVLGRAGCLVDAKQFLQSMPVPSDKSGWISLLNACKKHNDDELGKQCFHELAKWGHETFVYGN